MWLPAALQQITRRYPDNIAVSAGKRGSAKELSYSQLWQRSEHAALQLQELGVSSGDRVAILSPGSLHSVIALWAIWKCGAASVFLNEQLTSSGLQQIIDDVQPKVILGQEKLIKNLDDLSAKLSAEIIDLERVSELDRHIDQNSSGSSAVSSASEWQNRASSAANNIASIIYTSGSTGTPKGVCLSHNNLWTVVQADSASFAITESDSYLMAVPLHYVHGLLQLLLHQLAGATVHLLDNFMFPKVVTRKLQETAATGFSGVPFHFAALMDRGDLLQASLPALRWVGITGGRMAEERLDALRTAQPSLDIHISYGQTECGPRISTLSPEKIDDKPASVGQPPHGIKVKLVDENGNEVPNGNIGEVLVKGDNIMLGYWGDDSATLAVIDTDGWLQTGDLGYFDSDNDLFLKGRKQAMIKSAGERIFPEELEQVLLRHESVSEAAVVGVPDDLYGQRVEAHVVYAENEHLDTSHLHEFCLVDIPFVKAPKHYHVWLSLPTKANGKVDRQTLIQHSLQCASSQASDIGTE